MQGVRLVTSCAFGHGRRWACLMKPVSGTRLKPRINAVGRDVRSWPEGWMARRSAQLSTQRVALRRTHLVAV